MLDKHILLEALQKLYKNTLENSKNDMQEFHSTYPTLKTEREKERYIKEHDEKQVFCHTKAQKINKNIKLLEELY